MTEDAAPRTEADPECQHLVVDRRPDWTWVCSSPFCLRSFRLAPIDAPRSPDSPDTDPTTRPTTQSGRDTLDDVRYAAAPGSPYYERLRQRIIAIEAEARSTPAEALDPRGNRAIEAIDRIQRAILMKGRVASDGTLITTEVIEAEAREAIRDFHADPLSPHNREADSLSTDTREEPSDV